MLVSYILEVSKMDVEIVVVLRKKPIVKPKEASYDVSKVKLGRIHKDNWSMIFQQSARDGSNTQRCFFSLSNKHLYSTSCLNYILELIGQCKANDVASKKCFADMTRWYIAVRNTLLSLMPKLFKTRKCQQQ
ncbi:unnamed protein product [Lactuca saligna]|uniref:Uncharacterized protein n=1 Tax=Lactuca saligna TaxID=75948 RepID=A0AA36ENC0_LACSI|nr:unnamed protein product [Lactuca saligna]